jgi:hypothetical protein
MPASDAWKATVAKKQLLEDNKKVMSLWEKKKAETVSGKKMPSLVFTVHLLCYAYKRYSKGKGPDYSIQV